MNLQSNKYFSEINTKKIFFTNYNNSNINYEDFLVPLRCALYVLDDNDKKDENNEKEESKENYKEKEKIVIKKKITFSKNNNIINKKEKVEVVNNYDKKEKDDINNLENDELKIENIVKKYNKFIDMILFIIEKNNEILNEKNICLMDLFNKYDKEKYFKMLCTKDKDYIYWKQYGLEPPIIYLSKILDGKINILNKNPHTIYFEKIK